MLGDLASRWYFAPRVVHRLPGRLRVHFTALLHVERDRSAIESLVERALSVPPGVNEAKACCRTGNALVNYDPARLSEDELVKWIESVARALAGERERLFNTPSERLPSVCQRIAEELERAARYRIELPKEVKIPDDVWS